jgi:hypothetical protein
MSDERRNVPSASTMLRVDKCPGSHKAAAACPPLPESEDATAGKLIHGGLEFGPGSPQWESLSPRDEQTAGMCWDQMLSILGEWAGIQDDCADTEEHLWTTAEKERRLGLTVMGRVVPVTPESPAKFICTGMADVDARRGKSACIIDYKTGREEVSQAADNAQLRTLAVLAHGETPHIEEVWTAIVQPWVGKPTVAVFNADALRAAKAWLIGVLDCEKKATPDDLHAGDWCKYCPAQINCPAFRAAIVSIERPMRLDTLPLDKDTQKAALFARAMELPAQTLLEMKDKLHLLSMLENAVNGALRKRVEDEDLEICAQWTLVPGKKVRKIIDPSKAYAALQPLGVTLQDFWAAADVSIGPLEESLRRTSGKKTKKGGGESSHYNMSVEEAKRKLTDALIESQALELKQNAPQLKEVKLLTDEET